MTEYVSNTKLAKKLNVWAYILSVIILVTVVMMRKIQIDLPFETKSLPATYSILNIVTALILIYALIKVKAKQIIQHRNAIMLAMFTSAVFLIMYVLYHITNEPVKYCGEGPMRIIYFVLLITHILAAAVIFPFILFTFVRGISFQVEKHRKMGRWVFPIWLFVTISGPITYLLLLPCY